MKKGLIALALTGLLGAFGTGCSDPCGDIKACCEALLADLPEEAKAAGQATCDAYDEADSDACDAAIDAVQPVEGADLPEECNFE